MPPPKDDIGSLHYFAHRTGNHKRDITNMSSASAGLMRLRPVRRMPEPQLTAQCVLWSNLITRNLARFYKG